MSFTESIILTCQLFKTTTPFNITRTINQPNRQSTYSYKRNIEAHSCNHVCNEKAISITYSECVFVALCIQHIRVKHMRRVAICYMSDSTIFLHIFL